jgi:hypothetical protein
VKPLPATIPIQFEWTVDFADVIRACSVEDQR